MQDTFRRHGYFALPPAPPPPPKPVEVAAKPKAATQPTTNPTTGPAVAQPPKKVYPKDPLASPDDMVEALTCDVPPPPQDRPVWSRLDDARKKALLSRYEQWLSQYKPKDDFHGKNVSWDNLILEKVESTKGQITITASSGRGYLVTATVSEKDNEPLLLKKQGAAVQMTGTIQDYTLELKAPIGDEMTCGTTETFGVLVKDAKVRVREKK